MRQIIVIAHDVRSTHNIGSLLRTADGIGVEKLYFSGISPYPPSPQDSRLPHIAQKAGRQIHKTALGAEDTVPWQYVPDIADLLQSVRQDGFSLVALEQTPTAIPLHEWHAADKVALLLGNEVEGVDHGLLDIVDTHVVIPMAGTKESYNVVQAAAMALYRLRFY